jgi:hypothetical protein
MTYNPISMTPPSLLLGIINQRFTAGLFFKKNHLNFAYCWDDSCPGVNILPIDVALRLPLREEPCDRSN